MVFLATSSFGGLPRMHFGLSMQLCRRALSRPGHGPSLAPDLGSASGGSASFRPGADDRVNSDADRPLHFLPRRGFPLHHSAPSSLLPFLSQKVGWPLPPFVLSALKMIFKGVQVQVGVR